MIYQKDKLLLIAGPCSLENANICRATADVLAKLRDNHTDLTIIFKGSFDKANRTSINSDRGTGMVEGLKLLEMIKKEYDFPVLTDIHLPDQCAPIAEVCDVLQIPAFLCRQTDLLVAAAKTKKVVNVKKGQFLSPFEMGFVVSKLEEAKALEIWQTERGSMFGYQNLVVDMRSIPMMQSHQHPAIFDATHSVQLPGAAGGVSGGQREYVPCLARAAIAAGANGLFIETHPEPHNAISDRATQIPLAEFPQFVQSCLKIWQLMRIL